MKTTDKKLPIRVITLIFLLFSCFYMYDFYKCLSGFIANGFREPLAMLPLILSYFLPVFCFLFFVYDVYVKAIHPIIKTVYSTFTIAYAGTSLILIFSNIELYLNNNALGVYNALPSFFVHFPYDMIILLFVLAIVQILNLFVFDKKSSKLKEILNEMKQHETLKISVLEYVLLSVLAIIVFVFTGAAIYATFSAIENALYDFRYFYLLIWVMLIPLGNLTVMAMKPEKMNINKKSKLIALGGGIAVNVIFALLFFIFEYTNPDFLIHISKPLFLITFSVSLPIEPCIIFGIMALGTLVMLIRMLLVLIDKTEN